jgi:hypothetical protein
VATQEADLRMAIFVLIEYQFFEALFGSFLARAFASFDIMGVFRCDFFLGKSSCSTFRFYLAKFV